MDILICLSFLAWLMIRILFMHAFDAMAIYASDEENDQGLINSPLAYEGEDTLAAEGENPLDVEPLPPPVHHPLAVEPFPFVFGMFDWAEAEALFGERAEDDRNGLAYILSCLSFLARLIIRILFEFDAMNEENNERLSSLAVHDPLVVEPLPPGMVESAEAEDNDDGLAAESEDALAIEPHPLGMIELAEAEVLFSEPAGDDGNSLALIEHVSDSEDEEGFGSEDEEG